MDSILRRLFAPLALCALLCGCAQTGPPLPPSLELPKPPADMRAGRKGNRVTLMWTEPIRTTDRQSVRYLGPTRICRSLDAEMKECGTPVGQLPPPAAGTGAKLPAPQEYVDSLPPTLLQQNPTGDISYAVEVLNRDGRSGGLSNRVQVPAAPTLPPPADFRAELTGAGVILTWTGAGEDSSVPSISHRYRIYRRDEDAGKDLPALQAPMEKAGPMQVLDSSFEWEKTYSYRVTVVSVVTRSAGEAQVEGDDSLAVRVVAHDVFPPAVPAGLQAVYSGEGRKPFVDLIWTPVTDFDLAGYNVYRHEGDGAPVKLNTELGKAPAYRDGTVASGKTYFYSVSAVDVRSNESARSEEASESVPAQP